MVMVKAHLCLFVALLGLAVLCVDAFEASKFRMCDAVGFCKRHRALSPGESSYSVVANSYRQNGNTWEFDIENTKGNQPLFVGSLTVLSDETVRFQMKEKEGLRQRYAPPDILLPSVSSLEVASTIENTVNGTSITFGRAAVHVRHHPFIVEVWEDGAPTITFNSRGLLDYEHYREKPAPKEETPEGEEPAVEEATDDAIWEEKDDDKPHGPASFGSDISFIGSSAIYGIPERTADFALKPTKGVSEPYRMYNLDVFEYDLNSPFGLYGSIPVMLANDGKGTRGVFWNNPSETYVDVEDGTESFMFLFSHKTRMDTHWFSESGMLDLFFFTGPTPADVMRQYTSLTGTTPIPPMFSIAYHQCRWNYKDEPDVTAVNNGFEEFDIPYDVLWLDIEHTNGKRYFTWDSGAFPTPERMQNELAHFGRKMVTIVDPHIKRDSGYHIHSEASDQGYYVKDKDGEKDYEGWCWPGSSSWLDFTSPNVREWYGNKFALDQYQGSTEHLYTWNDMNEPSVFTGPEVTMRKDAIHWNNVEHRDVHNIYGLYQQRATAEGQSKAHGNTRPFVLSRAFYAGSQRYGAVWTGDNAAEWGHLEASIPMLLTLGVTGLPFGGADVGGFFNNPDAELLVRWYQVGALQPFFRGHAHLDTKRREPYLFDEPYRTHIRDAIISRYVHLPYFYTLFHEHEQTGAPVMRPMWYHYWTDAETLTMQHQYLLGQDLLIAPVYKEGEVHVDVYFPGQEKWFDMKSGYFFNPQSRSSVNAPLDAIPVFQRGGSIVPKKYRLRRSSALMANDPYTLEVAVGSNGEASGDLYVDDGMSFAHEQGDYALVRYTFSGKTLSPKTVSGTRQVSNTIERVVVAGLEAAPTSVTLTNGGSASQLGFNFDNNTKLLTIRKPDVPVSGSWSITLH